jgi:hypothetical protein
MGSLAMAHKAHLPNVTAPSAIVGIHFVAILGSRSCIAATDFRFLFAFVLCFFHMDGIVSLLNMPHMRKDDL